MLTSQLVFSSLPSNTRNIFIAYSGGKDSHVLLHLLGSITEIKPKITAVHINHGLQCEADEWETHCQMIAMNSGINFQCIKVDAHKNKRQSQEEAARNARYQAFFTLLAEGDVLLLAQHREDQLETLLLQLFRGAGVQGLAGMPVSSTLGKGRMIRPLLDVSRAAINEYAVKHNLHWVEDPSNKNNDFDRNFLRNQILPQLKQRWPALDKTVSRSARHCANSYLLNESLAQQLLDGLYNEDDGSLDIQRLLKLAANKQHLLIRYWFDTMQLRMPSEKTTIRIIEEVLKAKQSANPQIKTKSFCIRRYRNKLFCFKADPSDFAEQEKFWDKKSNRLDLKGGILSVCDASEGISKELWRDSEVWVRFRTGSEKIKLPGRQGHHSLKKLFQEQEIPPWERDLLPLIYINRDLVAVADLWISADFISEAKNECLQFHWLKNRIKA